MTETKKAPWYKEGLSFECTGCGKCCAGCPGYVWIDEAEMLEMAEFLKLPLKDFQMKYVRQIGQKFSLKELPGRNYSCVFLDGKKCNIYGARPKQCRTYPFWPKILKSESTWKDEAKSCEGISKDAPIVPIEEIEKKSGL